ncbi:unnamed protein product [Phytophthora lilii]|uniref:Unnamed protein product n=1 Tax=Phytophthora lilii TaxID=2077276 RepID=A0A9W7CPK9_9STRA|nr:unnamed protein product [Phytophthora lilii]
MDSAAYNGHLDVVLYLLKNRSEGFSGNAMETPQDIEMLCLFRNIDSEISQSNSQSNQQLQRLKVVFEERPDFFRGCLRSLAEIACERGNLKILDWLYPFGLELCSTIPTRNAVRRRDLALVRWFYRNGYEVNEPVLLELALDVDVARWLYEHGFQIVSHELAELAANCRNIPLMRWLIERGPPLDLATGTTLVIKYSYFEITWMLAEEDRVCMVLELLRNNNNRELIWWVLRQTEIKDQDSLRSIRNAVKDAPSNTLIWLQDNLSPVEACNWVFQHTGKRSTGDFTIERREDGNAKKSLIRFWRRS